MATEHLEWLAFSPPAPPAAAQLAVSGASSCPACDWPVAPGADACAHCGRPLAGEPAGDWLAALGIELPTRIIEVMPPPDGWFDRDSLDSPAIYDLRLQAERLRVTTGFDRLVCLDDISVDHYQHQLEAALRALRDMRGRALLADEVGLGKTIEAGIVMKELIERGLVASVLILVPAPLTWQWHEEMLTKFHAEFTVLESLEQFIPTAPGRWIISLDRAKSNSWSERLLAREYDLLVVDEAHKLKNQHTQVYRFVDAIRKRYVLMLTATPVHNDLEELYNLVTILRPGHLGTRRAFRRDFVAGSDTPLPPPSPTRRRSARRTVYSSRRIPAYLRKSREARQAYRQDETNSRWILKRTENFSDLDVPKLDKQAQKAATEIKQLIADGYEVVDFEAIEWRDWLRRRRDGFVCRLKSTPRPRPHPRAPRVEHHTTPRNTAALRGLLQEVMIRNRRSSVSVRFPLRKAAVYYLNLTPPERALYDGVTAYIRERLQGSKSANQQAGDLLILGEEGGTEPHRGERPPALACASPCPVPVQGRGGPGFAPTPGALRLTLMMLQKRLCSSPQAVARTLERLAEREADPRLADYLALAQSITRGRKVAATQVILEQYPGKFLIFTDYLPTLHALRAALDQAGHETVVFHGDMSVHEQVEAVRAFRLSARVMISTQSGGEGHNLQFCHQMINYDLPWNPMRIEQRIGRIHRLGQKHEVAIFNLSATNTIEAYVLDLLARKIRMFELVIGELDLILGALDDERGFEDYIREAWAGSRSEAELLQKIAELEALIDGARATYEQIRTASDELSGWAGE